MLPLPLEQQVSSLALSQKMRDLGFPQKSLFWWKKDEGEPYIILQNSRYATSKGELLCSAYTVAELENFLPQSILYRNKFGKPVEGDFRHRILTSSNTINKLMKYYEYGYMSKYNEDNSCIDFRECDENASIALSNLCVTLSENGLLDVTKL